MAAVFVAHVVAAEVVDGDLGFNHTAFLTFDALKPLV